MTATKRIAALAACAAALATGSTTATAADLAPSVDPLPMRLPADGPRAARSAPATWLLGVAPTRAATRLATRLGARPVTAGAFVVDTRRARGIAARLRAARVLRYAEPDIGLRHASAPDGRPDLWGRAAVVAPSLVPPPLAPATATIGILDEVVDVEHPDVGPQTRVVAGGTGGVRDPHGTMVASAAAASAGNGGVFGVLPGAPLLSYGVDDPITCADVARGVAALDESGARVINISLGSQTACTTLYRVVTQAIGGGVVVTAAAGNEFQAGNPVAYPAAFPHVLSVAAVAPDLSSAGFSNRNLAIDVSAPGVAVPVAVPPAFDVEDGSQDGVTLADGTSFSAPMVAGAAAWVRTVRRDLTGLQVADVLRQSAVDLGRRGWDPDFGWGLASVERALAAPEPRIDPFEPNDDLPMINGVWFSRPDAPIFTGGARSLQATVDFAEDPHDAYRIRVPARSAARASLTPQYGDPDLFAYRGTARSISQLGRRIARSIRSTGTDRVTVRNRSRRARTFYLVVGSTDTDGRIDAGYRLRIARAR